MISKSVRSSSIEPMLSVPLLATLVKLIKAIDNLHRKKLEACIESN